MAARSDRFFINRVDFYLDPEDASVLRELAEESTSRPPPFGGTREQWDEYHLQSRAAGYALEQLAWSVNTSPVREVCERCMTRALREDAVTFVLHPILCDDCERSERRIQELREEELKKAMRPGPPLSDEQKRMLENVFGDGTAFVESVRKLLL